MKIIFFCFIYCCLISPIKSYSQTKEQSIRELISLMSQDSLMSKVFKESTASFLLIEKDSIKRDGLKKSISNAAPRLELMNKNFLEKEVIPVYNKHFSHKEIKSLIEFYTSDVGKKTLNVTPLILGELMKVLMEKYLPEITKIFLLN